LSDGQHHVVAQHHDRGSNLDGPLLRAELRDEVESSLVQVQAAHQNCAEANCALLARIYVTGVEDYQKVELREHVELRTRTRGRRAAGFFFGDELPGYRAPAARLPPLHHVCGGVQSRGTGRSGWSTRAGAEVQAGVPVLHPLRHAAGLRAARVDHSVRSGRGRHSACEFFPERCAVCGGGGAGGHGKAQERPYDRSSSTAESRRSRGGWWVLAPRR